MAPCSAQLPKVHATNVPAPQLPQQPEVAQPKIPVSRSDSPDGLPPRIICLVGLVCAAGAEAARAAAAFIIRATARAAAPAIYGVADLGAATAIADADSSGIADPGGQEAVLGFGVLRLATQAAAEGALVAMAGRKGLRSRFFVAGRVGSGRSGSCRWRFKNGIAGAANGVPLGLVLLGRRVLLQEKRGRVAGIDLGAAGVVTAGVLAVIGATSMDASGILLASVLRGAAGIRNRRFDDEVVILSGGGGGGCRHMINHSREREEKVEVAFRKDSKKTRRGNFKVMIRDFLYDKETKKGRERGNPELENGRKRKARIRILSIRQRD